MTTHSTMDFLKIQDERSRESRAKRLDDIGIISYDLTSYHKPPESMSEFVDESIEAYKQGTFRSCILCCASAVDQAFKHELIFSTRELSHRDDTFGVTIGKAEKYDRLRPYLLDAKWLNEVRNKVAAHPWPIGPKSVKYDNNWNSLVDQAMRDDIKTLRRLLPNNLTKGALDNIGTEDHAKLAYLEWFASRSSFLQLLAITAFDKMRNIIQSLYPT